MLKIKSISTEQCPKCYIPMERRKRTQSRTDKRWYTEWDYCVRCKHVQHYEKYKQNPTKTIEYFQKDSKENEEKIQTLF